MDTWFSQNSATLNSAKAALGLVIAKTVRDRGLNCHSLAELLIADCTAIEDLLEQRLERYTLSTLLRYAGVLKIPLIHLDEALANTDTKFYPYEGVA